MQRLLCITCVCASVDVDWTRAILEYCVVQITSIKTHGWHYNRRFSFFLCSQVLFFQRPHHRSRLFKDSLSGIQSIQCALLCETRHLLARQQSNIELSLSYVDRLSSKGIYYIMVKKSAIMRILNPSSFHTLSCKRYSYSIFLVISTHVI